MNKFYITKLVTNATLATLVNDLNTRTRDGHVDNQTQVAQDLWLLRIACSWRDDADLVRGL